MIAKALTVTLEDRPGALAELAETLASTELNIEAVCGTSSAGGTLHVLVTDPDAAKEALASAGIQVEGERTVLIAELADRPGQLSRICRRIADTGANIELVYLATRTRLVIGVDDIYKARAAI